MSGQRESETSFVAAAKGMQEVLVAWRGGHPGASFDEIAAEVCREWRRLMSELVAEVAMQPKREVKALAPQGAQWQGEREGQGSKERWGNHLAGDAQA